MVYLHHIRKIVHGDIKGANVLLNHDIEPMLCDFGLSKILDGERTSTPNRGAGSTKWMSPERLAEDTGPTLEADIWSFGATIVEVVRCEPWSLRPNATPGLQ